jgi:hypothetical protein
MSARPLLALAFALALAAAPKPPGKVATATGENKDVSLTVTLYLDPADMERLLGDDLGKGFILAEVKFQPRNGKDILVDRDDFTLRTDSNGARATPFAPSQIAGAGALILREVDEGEAKATASAGPFGGLSRKRADPKRTEDSKKSKSSEPVAPGRSADRDESLLQTLRAKELPQTKTAQPVSGLLYFGMEKQKMKDLSITYGPAGDRITLRFQ